MECPICFARVQIILNETLLIGDVSQIDYTKTSDKVAPYAPNKQQNFPYGSSAAGSLGHDSSRMISVDAEIDLDDIKPQLLYSKF